MDPGDPVLLPREADRDGQRAALERDRDPDRGDAGAGGLGQRRAHPGDRPMLGSFVLPRRPQPVGRHHWPERRRESLAEVGELPVPGHVDDGQRRAGLRCAHGPCPPYVCTVGSQPIQAMSKMLTR
jgi:hypothetical protein